MPQIAGRSPIVLILEPGTYDWCLCGLSKTQPFCDGSHAACPEGSQPLSFTLSEAKRCALCTCKRTKNPPFCDGTHKSLPPAEVPAP